MKSILNEIRDLRKSEELNIDYSNNNRYRVVINENDGSKTAYCFNTPIYNARSRKAVNLKFRATDHAFYAEGSNAKISISDEIRLENAEGACKIRLQTMPESLSEHELICNKDHISQTLNGVLYCAYLNEYPEFTFDFEVSSPHFKVRTNEKYFALMSAKFRPFVSISCLGAINDKNEIIAPAKVTYKKLTDRTYRIIIAPHTVSAAGVLFEINLYEQKLIQDTTVESLNPKRNNAFGSVAYLGKTDAYGEQWLYLRPEFTNIIDLMNKNVSSDILHFPKLINVNISISAYKTARRFCSFGSKWSNKVPIAEFMTDLDKTDQYFRLNATKWLVKPWANRLIATAGFVLKPRNKKNEFSVISTGDNYSFPIIMEIKYKN